MRIRVPSKLNAGMAASSQSGADPCHDVSCRDVSCNDASSHDACSHDACSAAPALSRQLAWLQAVTLIWMTIECAGSLLAASHAHSIALLAFGSDSLVELLSAVVVLLQFMPRFPLKKQHAQRASAILLYVLALVVVGLAFLAAERPLESSSLGMAVTGVALVLMPVLAWLKRRQARAIHNAALAADAAQSATCAYLAATTLAGLAAYALWHIRWVDTAAALVAIPVLLVEGRRVWRGEDCGCCA